MPGKWLDIGICQHDISSLNVKYAVDKPKASVNSGREQRGRASEPSEVLGDSHERNQYPDHD